MHKLNAVAEMKPSEQERRDISRCMSCMLLTGEFPGAVELPSISNNTKAENCRQKHFQESWSLTDGLCQGAWPWVLPLQKEGLTLELHCLGLSRV